MSALIRAAGLKKYFKVNGGLLHAVDDLNFTIEKGTTLGVVGESGCGKTTLGRMLMGLIPATEGSISFGGEEVVGRRGEEMRRLRSRMQIIFQDPHSSLNPRHTVAQSIAEPIICNRLITDKRELRARVLELMDTVGLAGNLYNAYPHELDGGRKQRVGIARALSVDPEFIVCDEPVSALDVSIQAQILNLLMDLQQSLGLTYVFITHNLSVVRHISDEILVMYLGRCVEKSAAKRLFENPAHPYTRALLAAVPKPGIESRGKRADLIIGEIASPVNPKPGCRFAPRCRHVSPRCGGPVALTSVESGHEAACTIYNTTTDQEEEK